MTSEWRPARLVCAAAMIVAGAVGAGAQTAPVPPTTIASSDATAEDDVLEPRVVARGGTTQLGVTGAVDRLQSSETSYPTHLTLHVHALHFLTGHLAARAGVTGTVGLGGSASEDERRDRGAPALHGAAGLTYFFTPGSMASPYAGAEYRARLTDRPDGDRGGAVGLAGLQVALSSRAGLYLEGGYGVQFSRGADRELQTRLTGALGLRVRF